MKEKPHPDMSFEMEARDSGFLCVAGVDEAGRGPLAGPVVAGAVILPVLAEELTGLNDSKQLTAAKRDTRHAGSQRRYIRANPGRI